MSVIATIKVPAKRDRNPLAIFQKRKQPMRDRRLRRQKDARRQREPFDYGE